MKSKFLSLTWPQRVILLLQVFLVILFWILYSTLGRQQVIEYDGALLRYRSQGDTATYSGKLDGQKAVFTVSPGPVVEYRLGDTLYGPYTMTEDPTAIPQENEMAEYLTGVEIRKDGQVWFRGAYDELHGFSFLFSEDGSSSFSGVKINYGDSVSEPDPADILRIALEPDPVPRGSWTIFGACVFCCAFCAVSILFADKLFRWNLRFLIRDPENAEPSDWALFSRWFAWILLTIVALGYFIAGLNAP